MLTNQQIQNREELCENLRSGKYKQTFGHYKKDGCYCALGVMFDLHIDGPWLPEGTSSFTKRCNYSQLMNLYGCSFEQIVEVLKMNDTYKYTFEQIADYIESL